jgi:hypothetical protein
MIAIPALLFAAAQPPGIRTTSEQSFHPSFGMIVGEAGDIDLDGVPDVLMGDPNSPLVPRLWSLSGTDGSVLREIELPDFRQMTWRVEGGVDVDRDGVPDVLVSGNASVGHIRFGRVELFSGKTGSIRLKVDVDDPAGAMCEWAHLVSDIDGDGFADIGVLVLDHGEKRSTLLIRSGRTGEILDTLEVFNEWDSRFGGFLEVGDLDGDGFQDYAVELERCEHGTVCVRAYSRAKHALIWEFRSPVKAHDIQTAMIDAGDIDGDCVHDIALGLKNRVELISGKTGSPLRHFDAEREVAGDGWLDETEFGQALAVIGDERCEGAGDLAIAEPEFDGFGRVSAKSLGNTKRSWESRPAACHPGEYPAQYGWQMAPLGDVDGDGFGDLIVGSMGLPRVLSGRDGSVIFQICRSEDELTVTKRSRPVNEDR